MMTAGPPLSFGTFSGLAIIALLGACQQPTGDGEPSSSPDPSAYADLMLMPDASRSAVETNAKTCSEIGGTWRRDGMMGAYHCFDIYADGGQSCTDSAQCEGECRVTEPEANIGQCQIDSGPFGCHGELIDGKSTGFICID